MIYRHRPCITHAIIEGWRVAFQELQRHELKTKSMRVLLFQNAAFVETVLCADEQQQHARYMPQIFRAHHWCTDKKHQFLCLVCVQPCEVAKYN